MRFMLPQNIRKLSTSCFLRITNVASPVINLFEDNIRNNLSYNRDISPIFVIGSPRSGTTITHQIISNNFKVCFPNNLNYYFQRNIIFGTWLNKKIFNLEKGHNSFSSNYGQTPTFTAPNEIQGYWNLKFPKIEDISAQSPEIIASKDEIVREIEAITELTGMNFIAKNVGNCQRIDELANLFPLSRFVYLKRSPYFTIQSLYKARIARGIPESNWWSVKPPNYTELENLPLISKLVAQIYYNEYQVNESIQKLASKRVFKLNYQSFIEQYDDLSLFVGEKRESEVAPQNFQFMNKVTVDKKIEFEIRSEMKNYDWKKLGYE